MNGIKKLGVLCLFLLLSFAMFMMRRDSLDTFDRKLKPIVQARRTIQKAKPYSKTTSYLFDIFKLTDLEILQPLNTPRPHFNLTLLPDISRKVPKYLVKEEIKWSMLVAIKSHYQRRSKRDLIRETWGGIRFAGGVRISVIYVVAQAKSEEEQEWLKNENIKFGDLLQVEMNETYQGVGYKAMAVMKWIGDHFPKEWWYFSADDDVLPDFQTLFSNMQILMEEAKSTKRSLPIHCAYQFRSESSVARRGKWKTSREEYPYRKYPPACMGGFYGLTVKLTKALYNTARHYPYYRHDDIFLTGFMRLAMCDSLSGTEFHFDKADPCCALSTIPNSNFKHVHVSPKNYTKSWVEKEEQMVKNGIKVIRKPS